MATNFATIAADLGLGFLPMVEERDDFAVVERTGERSMSGLSRAAIAEGVEQPELRGLIDGGATLCDQGMGDPTPFWQARS